MKKLLRTYSSQQEAELAAGLLRANGINCSVESDDAGGYTQTYLKLRE